MIEADLAVVGISELATPEGTRARTGGDLGRLRLIRDAAVACKDGRFVFKQEEECLAACAGAPMMMVDHVYFEDLTIEKVDQILGGLK